jgi:hypothetical protein
MDCQKCLSEAEKKFNSCQKALLSLGSEFKSDYISGLPDQSRDLWEKFHTKNKSADEEVKLLYKKWFIEYEKW